MKKWLYFWICFTVTILGASAQQLVEDFFTNEGGNTPITLNGGQHVGQRFTATQPFEGIQVNGPTWSISGEKGMTIRLYRWAGSYASTVAQTPIATSVLVNLNDNDWFPCYVPTELPPGSYFWEASEPTNSNPDRLDPFQIGAWLYNASRYTGGEGYFNGVPYDDVSIEWMDWYALDQGGAWTPFPFSFSANSSLAQSFDVPYEFQAVGIYSPTWNGFGAAYRMSLYSWNTDYATTVSQASLGQRTFTNLSDNARNDMILDRSVPAGRYLVVTDQPVPSNTGLVGHWGWVNSSWEDGDINVAYIDGQERIDFASYHIAIGEPSSEPVGKDFASRSVTGVATPVKAWELY